MSTRYLRSGAKSTCGEATRFFESRTWSAIRRMGGQYSRFLPFGFAQGRNDNPYIESQSLWEW